MHTHTLHTHTLLVLSNCSYMLMQNDLCMGKINMTIYQYILCGITMGNVITMTALSRRIDGVEGVSWCGAGSVIITEQHFMFVIADPMPFSMLFNTHTHTHTNTRMHTQLHIYRKHIHTHIHICINTHTHTNYRCNLQT